MVCHEPTGKAGRGEDSLYTPNGVGPWCERCWDDAWPVAVPDVADAWSAKLAEIRAAVEAERGEVETLFRAHDVPDTGQVLRPWWTKQYALDALLAVIP